MKTNFEAGVIDTKGYDVIAELEDQNLKEYLIRRREEAAQKRANTWQRTLKRCTIV